MLFSNEKIANFVNENFESSWQSVRPVPMVTIDFGNNTTITRTLHGNIATYVCGSDAKVLDVLPGVYDPDAYLEKLQELKLLSEYMVQPDRLSLDRSSRLLKYHRTRAETIESGRPFVIKKIEVSRSTIRGVEKGIEIVLNPVERLATRRAMRVSAQRSSRPTSTAGRLGIAMDGPSENDGLVAEAIVTPLEQPPESVSSEAHAKTKVSASLSDRLATDTRINEEFRRLQIHRYILGQGLTTPDDMHKWLYREVLHADLDDPYMGLGKVLFENYPFVEEDAVNPE